MNFGLELELCLWVSNVYTHGVSFISSHTGHLIPTALQELIGTLKHSNPCFVSFPCTYADAWHNRKENPSLSTE